MATNINNFHHGALPYFNIKDGAVVCATITGAADVNANGYTVTDGQWLKAVTKVSEGIMRVQLDRTMTGYLYGFSQCNLATTICAGCTAQSLTASGGSTFDFTFYVSGSVTDPDSSVIGIQLILRA